MASTSLHARLLFRFLRPGGNRVLWTLLAEEGDP
jgi:hypothetical protein